MITILVAYSAIGLFQSKPQQVFELEPLSTIRISSRYNAERFDGRQSRIGVRVTGNGFIDERELYTNFEVKIIPSTDNPLQDSWQYFKEKRKAAKERIALGLIGSDHFQLMPPRTIEVTSLSGKPAKLVTFPYIKEEDGEYLGRAMVVSYSNNHAVFVDVWARVLDPQSWQKEVDKGVNELLEQLKKGFVWRRAPASR